VRYRLTKTDGETIEIENPQKMPDPAEIASIEEPFFEVTMLTTDEYVGPIIALAIERRGVQKKLEYVSTNRVMLVYDMPLNEVILDFFDKLKSISRGYASLDYQFIGYRESDLVKMDILVNGEPLDALSLIVHKDKAFPRGKMLVEKMKEFIPRQMFEVALQAAIGNRIVARETVKALRKNVLAKCYGGDISRKRKLLEKQKEGKKRMKRVGKVEIPQEAFLAVLKID
ncbi:MAG TPA: elongation factor 4, partial [Thermoanaerobaculia bacterium]|nr:elongation factor 4 [Thermoanaerobaculia bacterium]